MKIVINATNLGMGGGVTHLKEFIAIAIKLSDDNLYIVYAQNKILKQLPDNRKLIKKTHPLIEKTIFHRLIFHFFYFDRFIPANSIIYSLTGDYLGTFKPVIGIPQNMLLYEREYWRNMNFVEKARFYINSLKQKKCFAGCSGLIFNSKFSQDYINSKLGFVNNISQRLIYHGISNQFRFPLKTQIPIQNYTQKNPFVFVYVSTIHTYKNHPNVVKAFSELIAEGYHIQLNLIGAVINSKAGKELEQAIKKYYPYSNSIKYHGFVDDKLLQHFYESCDGVIYASSCETMPITVIEAMTSGRPLVCSNKGPMPEFVKNYAYYFDPENENSIKVSIKEFLLSPLQRKENAFNAQIESEKYRWDITTQQTLDFIDQIYNLHYGSI